MTKYGQGIYSIVRDNGGWCVARLNVSTGRWHRISNLYSFKGWARNFARRMGLKVQNYAYLYR